MTEISRIVFCPYRVLLRINVYRRTFFHDKVDKIGDQLLLHKVFIQLLYVNRLGYQSLKELKVSVDSQPILRRILVQKSQILINESHHIRSILVIALDPCLD